MEKKKRILRRKKLKFLAARGDKKVMCIGFGNVSIPFKVYKVIFIDYKVLTLHNYKLDDAMCLGVDCLELKMVLSTEL